MARIILVLICGGLVFILVWKFAPHFLETYLPGATAGSSTSSPEATDKAAAATKKKAPVQKSKSGGDASRRSATASEATPVSEFAAPRALPQGITGTPLQAARTGAGPSRATARVTSENATLYLTNTSLGPVVGRLTKGAVVEPLFVVSSAGQNWTFVNAGDQEVAGFLRSDSLAKVKPAESSR